jgi:hypothetical protein
MSNDVGDDTQGEQNELSLEDIGLIGALARLASAQSAGFLKPLVDDPTMRLVDAFDKGGQPGLVVKVGDEIVGRYTTNLTQPKVVVDPENEKALDQYAEEHSGIEVIIRRNPTWEAALLKFARHDEETGEIIDSRTGEVIPGLKYDRGGRPTGGVTFTWEQKDIGANRLLRAWQSGAFDHLLQDKPQLMAGRPQPSAEDA